MKIDILTLFPDMFTPVLTGSILGRGQKAGLFEVTTHNLRDWAIDKHNTVDDTPYGGGPGMVLKIDVIDRALHDLRLQVTGDRLQVILLTPQGEPFSQAKAQELSAYDHLILIAGHYEGFDERVRLLVDRELSIGDYILTGGELPAMVVTDAIVRLLPGVLGADESSHDESFSEPDTLEYPHYTRPERYQPTSKPELGELTVPEILKSGDHGNIAAWRHAQAKERTTNRRPDLKPKA